MDNIPICISSISINCSISLMGFDRIPFMDPQGVLKHPPATWLYHLSEVKGVLGLGLQKQNPFWNPCKLRRTFLIWHVAQLATNRRPTWNIHYLYYGYWHENFSVIQAIDSPIKRCVFKVWKDWKISELNHLIVDNPCSPQTSHHLQIL